LTQTTAEIIATTTPWGYLSELDNHLASFRFSAALIVLSLCLHVVSATWPRVIVTAFFKGGSTMDTLLASAAAVLVLVAGLSPFPSMIHFFRYERDH
jgi:hypothetical protein